MAASRYYLEGKRVPGVTSAVTGQLGWGQRALMNWANRIGLAGTELSQYTRPADIGTYAHAMIEADIAGDNLRTAIGLVPKYDSDGPGKKSVRPIVKKILKRWQEWKSTRVEEVLLSEAELVSPTMRFGGRLDMVFRDPTGAVWILDVKTGGIYAEHLIQVAAYAMLVEEVKGIKIDTLAVLRIPQESDGLTTLERPWNRSSDEARAVKLCLELGGIQKRLKGEV